MEITGAQLFVKALKEEKVTILFGYPGGQAIDLFDALYGEEEIEVILPRHEQGLVHAADGYARSTGKVGGLSCNQRARSDQSGHRDRHGQL